MGLPELSPFLLLAKVARVVLLLPFGSQAGKCTTWIRSRLGNAWVILHGPSTHNQQITVAVNSLITQYLDSDR